MIVLRRTAATAGLGIALVIGLPVLAAPAAAHSELRAVVPADDARLAGPPAEVALEFNERLNARYTTVVVTHTDGTAAATGEVSVSGARATRSLRPGLPTGTYTVAYQVVSVDGHPVRGATTFAVGAPGEAAPSAVASGPAITPAAALPSAAADSTGGAGLTVAAILTSVAALGIGLAAWHTRRRAHR